MADRESDQLFKEVDDELRQERYFKLWKKYGNYVIGVALVAILGVGAFQAWQSYDQNRKSDDSALMVTALRSIAVDKADDANAILNKLGESGTSGYKALAKLDAAALKARAGNAKEAADAFLAASRDSALDQDMRNLALLLSALYDVDTGDAAELQSRIAPLTVAGSPWRHSAKELSAVLAQKAGDTQKAGQLYKELADDATAPQGIRARAAEMSAVLGG
jgi:hypothetical protein